MPAFDNAGEGRAEGVADKDYTGGRSGDRRTLAWYPDASDINRANISLVITNISADYTKM